MDNDLILPIEFEGKILELPARIVQTGYVVKLEVDIEGTTITYEPDEERNWRAVMGYEDVINGKIVQKELVVEVAKFIESITREM